MNLRRAVTILILSIVAVLVFLWGAASCATYILTLPAAGPPGEPPVMPSIFREDCDLVSLDGDDLDGDDGDPVHHYMCERTESDGRVIPALNCYLGSGVGAERYVRIPVDQVGAYCEQHDGAAYADYLARREGRKAEIDFEGPQPCPLICFRPGEPIVR